MGHKSEYGGIAGSLMRMVLRFGLLQILFHQMLLQSLIDPNLHRWDSYLID